MFDSSEDTSVIYYSLFGEIEYPDIIDLVAT